MRGGKEEGEGVERKGVRIEEERGSEEERKGDGEGGESGERGVRENEGIKGVRNTKEEQTASQRCLCSHSTSSFCMFEAKDSKVECSFLGEGNVRKGERRKTNGKSWKGKRENAHFSF